MSVFMCHDSPTSVSQVQKDHCNSSDTLHNTVTRLWLDFAAPLVHLSKGGFCFSSFCCVPEHIPAPCQISLVNQHYQVFWTDSFSSPQSDNKCAGRRQLTADAVSESVSLRPHISAGASRPPGLRGGDGWRSSILPPWSGSIPLASQLFSPASCSHPLPVNLTTL